MPAHESTPPPNTRSFLEPAAKKCIIIENFVLKRFFQFQGTICGALVLAAFFTFSICKFDVYYDLLLILELLLTLYIGYLVLLHDCDGLYRFFLEKKNSYRPDLAKSPINDLIDEKVMLDSLTYKLLIALFVIVLSSVFLAFACVNTDLGVTVTEFGLYGTLKYLAQRILDNFRENHELLHKVLHFGVGIAIMLFATRIISTLSFQRLTILIDILNEDKNPSKD